MQILGALVIIPCSSSPFFLLSSLPYMARKKGDCTSVVLSDPLNLESEAGKLVISSLSWARTRKASLDDLLPVGTFQRVTSLGSSAKSIIKCLHRVCSVAFTVRSPCLPPLRPGGKPADSSAARILCGPETTSASLVRCAQSKCDLNFLTWSVVHVFMSCCSVDNGAVFPHQGWRAFCCALFLEFQMRSCKQSSLFGIYLSSYLVYRNQAPQSTKLHIRILHLFTFLLSTADQLGGSIPLAW